MSWAKLSAVGEILSSIAILVTLVYLMIEIQQNTDALQTSARQATLQGDVEILLSAVDDPSLRINGWKEELTEAESVQMSAYLFAAMRIREHDWLQYQAGALDEATSATYQSGMIGQLSAPQASTWTSGLALSGALWCVVTSPTVWPSSAFATLQRHPNCSEPTRKCVA